MMGLLGATVQVHVWAIVLTSIISGIGSALTVRRLSR